MRVAGIVVGLLLLATALVGSLRTVFEPHRPFFRKFEDGTRQAYLVLVVAAVVLLVLALIPGMQIESFEIAGVKARVNTVEHKVDSLSEQMEVFFRRRKSETFDKAHNWNRVQIIQRTKNSQSPELWNFRLAIQLEQEPISGSVDIWWGINPMPDFKLDGKLVTLELPTSETPDAPFGTYDTLRVTYYPRSASAGK